MGASASRQSWQRRDADRSSAGESVSPLFNVLAARIVLTVAPCIVLVALLRTRILALR